MKSARLLLLSAWTLVSFLDLLPVHTWATDQNPVVAVQTLLDEKKFQAAVDLLAPQIEKLTGPQLRLLGQAYSGLQNPGMAIKTYAIALVKNPKDFESKTAIGAEQLSMGKDREALLSLREAIEINPHFEPPYLLIEKIYLKKNNKYEIRMLFADMIKQIGEKPLYVSRLCELNTLSGLYDDAKASCRRGIVLTRDDPKNYVFLSMALKETGALDEAKSLMRRAAANFPKSDEAQIVFAQFLDEQKDYIDSIPYYRAATVANAESLKAWLGLANASLEIQKFSDSFDAFKRACDLNPSTLPMVRRAMNTLRTLKADDWVARYDALTQTCGMKK